MRLLLIGVVIAISGFAAGAEQAVTLKDAPGRDIVEGYWAPVIRSIIRGSMRDFSIARAGKAKSAK